MMSRRCLHPRKAFTLVELMVVMAILAIILSFAITAFNNISKAGNLTNSSYMVQDSLKLARQMAVSQNRRIFVRFYKMKGDSGTDTAYRAFRILAYDLTGTPIPASALKMLPSGVVMMDDSTYSTILANTPDSGTEIIEGPAKGAQFKAVEFSPDGTVKLDPEGSGTDKWFVTLKAETDPATGGLPAKNFITVMLDPVTGRLRAFQP
ncbi:MAG: Verru_Chthon cassette protein D [Chthoniobacterales bacterium]